MLLSTNEKVVLKLGISVVVYFNYLTYPCIHAFSNLPTIFKIQYLVNRSNVLGVDF